MNEMQIFKNDMFGQVRIITENDKTLFCAFDVASALGYAKPRNAVSAHCKGALKRGVLTNGGMQDMTFIPEGDIYRLVVRSNLPAAEQFESWIFDEVLPSIRKHGAYATPATIDNIINDPDFGIRLLQELKAERDKSAELTAKIEADKPKVEFAEALETSTNSITVKQLSVLLAQRGCDTGEKRLFNEMREDGFLLTHGNYYNEPAQRYMDMKLFEVKTGTYTTAYGDTRNSRQTLITPKGLQYLMDYYMRKHGKMPLLSTARRKRV